MLPALAVMAGCGEREDVSPQSIDQVSMEIFENSNREWRERRMQRLTEPYGWLSLVGLTGLESGNRVTVGSDPENDVVVSSGPGVWGTVEVSADGEHVRFEVEASGAVNVDGVAVDAAAMRLGDPGEPTHVESEGVRIHLVAPGGRLALRVRDPDAPTRTGFAGLEYYPLDRGWRVEAEFHEHPAGTTMQVANVMGQLIDEPNPGVVRFAHEGKTISLEAVLEDDRLFFIFADRTSGRETYGLGRFLYADLPQDGHVVLDFNQAYNPPCAFNAYTTCPLPPQSNRIDAWIRAGEKRYAGKPGIEAPIAPPSGL